MVEIEHMDAFAAAYVSRLYLSYTLPEVTGGSLLAHQQYNVTGFVLQVLHAVTALLRSKYKLLNVCLQETLRLYPSAPSTDRVAPQDMHVGGYFIPKGTVLWISFYTIQHLDSVHDDPEVFRPVSNAGSHNVTACMPSSSGCILYHCICSGVGLTHGLHLAQQYKSSQDNTPIFSWSESDHLHL